MIKFASQYLNSAISLLNEYNGSLPLAHYLKDSFSKHKKFGSKDRKHISHLCYTYFRLGKALMNQGMETRIRVALYLSSSDQWAVLFSQDWELTDTLPEQRIQTITQQFPDFDVNDIFPLNNELSPSVDEEAFTRSFLVQPKLFIRLRPGNEQMVKKALEEDNVQFEQVNNSCLSIENATQIPARLVVNKDYVVQDFNSQQVSGFLPSFSMSKPLQVWDCCAASGGKSIMAIDHYQKVELTVSDVRKSILHNLQARFNIAGIKTYQSFIADLAQSKPSSKEKFDLIICDVPCSGSGTWARTPEQLYYFNREKIDEYATLQRKIVSNVIPSIKAGGYLLYITCSVFQKENEDAVNFILTNSTLKLINSDLLKGYEIQADTMFAALFQMN